MGRRGLVVEVVDGGVLGVVLLHLVFGGDGVGVRLAVNFGLLGGDAQLFS